MARGLVPSRPFPTCLRRPYLFSRKRKDREEKSAWTRLVHSAVRFRQESDLQILRTHILPYGRYGTRRLLRYTRFVNSCDSISAVKTPFVQNLQGSTDSPEFCRGRCPHRPAGQLRICRRFPKEQSILPGRCGHRPLQPVRANLLCISIKIYSRPGVLGREHTCFVVPPKFGSGWTLPSCAGDAGCAGPAISARCALYACSADVLPGAAARAFQRHGPLSGQAESRYCFRVVAKIKIIGSFSCSSSSYANPDRRAAIRGSAFLPRPDLSRTGRWTNRTGEACA